MTGEYQGTKSSSSGNTIISAGLEETTFGTAATAEMWSGLCDTFRKGKQDEVKEIDGITNYRTKQNFMPIARRYPVNLTGKIQNGVPFAMLLGNISAISNPVITALRGASHSTPSKVKLPSWTLRRTYDDESENLELLGVTFNDGTININLDDFWTYDINGVGKSESTTAATGVTIPIRGLGSWNTTLKIKEDAETFSDSGAYTINGWKSISLNVNNNLDIRNEAGITAPVSIRQPIPQKIDLSMSIGRDHIDSDLWTRLMDGSYNSFRASVTDGTAIIQVDIQKAFAKELTNIDQNIAEDKLDLIIKDMIVTITSDGITYVVWD